MKRVIKGTILMTIYGTEYFIKRLAIDTESKRFHINFEASYVAIATSSKGVYIPLSVAPDECFNTISFKFQEKDEEENLCFETCTFKRVVELAEIDDYRRLLYIFSYDTLIEQKIEEPDVQTSRFENLELDLNVQKELLPADDIQYKDIPDNNRFKNLEIDLPIKKNRFKNLEID